MRFATCLVVTAALAGCFYDETSPLPADFAACTAEGGGDVGVAQPTWYRDVEPIAVEKCQGCHSETGVAPFPLTAYEHFVPIRSGIYAAIDERRMPPWQPSPCCNAYLHDRSLSDEQRATMLRWFDQGMPLGDAADHQDVPPPMTGLPRVDLRATMAEPVTPVAKIGADEIRCFLLDHELTDRDRYITGFNFIPGARGEVHHVIVMAVPEDEVSELEARDAEDDRPGWDCWGEGAELDAGSKFIGGWQPGDEARVLPDGLGRLLPARTRIVLDIHYDTGHGVAPDQSSIELMLEDHVDRVEQSTAAGNPLWFLGEGMEIPAGAPDTKVWFSWDPTVLTNGKPIDLHKVMLHMHELGSIGRVAVLHPDGTADCLLDIPDWDFHWMGDYYFASPVRLDPGDELYVECHWDNTAANQKIVDGELQEPRTVHWGTDQEMCGAIVTYSEAVTP